MRRMERLRDDRNQRDISTVRRQQARARLEDQADARRAQARSDASQSQRSTSAQDARMAARIRQAQAERADELDREIEPRGSVVDISA